MTAVDARLRCWNCNKHLPLDEEPSERIVIKCPRCKRPNVLPRKPDVDEIC